MEEQLLQIIQETIKDPSYLGDDCAVVNLGSENYLFCLDNFIEATHFSLDYFTAADVGWKALAVNLSDIAAMAGEPLFALVGLSLNKDLANKEAWVKEFYKGMQECADKYEGVKIIGGDISSQASFSSISVTVVGKATKPVLRKALEKRNYKLCVTGKFGNSKNYLDNFTEADKAAHLRPEPRLKEARAPEIKAMMDTSDGLAAALFTMAEMNNASIEIDSNLVPRDEHVSLEQAFYGGEDYELLVCAEKCPSGFTEIGVMTYEDKLQLLSDKSAKLKFKKSKQYQHF